MLLPGRTPSLAEERFGGIWGCFRAGTLSGCRAGPPGLFPGRWRSHGSCWKPGRVPRYRGAVRPELCSMGSEHSSSLTKGHRELGSPSWPAPERRRAVPGPGGAERRLGAGPGAERGGHGAQRRGRDGGGGCPEPAEARPPREGSARFGRR